MAEINKKCSLYQLVFVPPSYVEMQETGNFTISFNQSLERRVHREGFYSGRQFESVRGSLGKTFPKLLTDPDKHTIKSHI